MQFNHGEGYLLRGRQIKFSDYECSNGAKKKHGILHDLQVDCIF